MAVVTTYRNPGQFLTAALLHEGATLFREAEIPTLPPTQQQPAPAAQPAVATPLPAEPAQTPEQPQQPTDNNMTVDALVDQLNDIRSGRSFSDPESYSKLTAVFNGLDPNSKPQFIGFLKQIADAVRPMNAAKPEQPATQQMTTSPTPAPATPAPQVAPAPTATPAPAL